MRSPGHRGHLLSAALLLLVAGSAGCVSEVPFYQRRALADPVMSAASGPREAHFFAQVVYSTEGSIGDVGPDADR